VFNLKTYPAEQTNQAQSNLKKSGEMKAAMKEIVGNRCNFDTKELKLE